MEKKNQPKLIISREELSRMIKRHTKMQGRNWKRHFTEHPEQLLPGVEVERVVVPPEEDELLCHIIGRSRPPA